MKQELNNLNIDQDEIIKIGKVLNLIRELINELKAFTRSYKFQNQSEEIQFFKEVKPVFLSQYFYYKKLFAIRIFDSFKDAKSKQSNYYRLLQQLEKSLGKNLEFYEYFMSGNTSMDSHYFTRGNQNHKSPNQDESFSTRYDTKLAKILSNELVRHYILNLLKDVTENQAPKVPLTWTGQKTDLTELIYALHAAGVFNNGSANIKLIAKALEDLFNINLGDYYRIFQEIRLRKRSQTPFLDHLKEKFSRRIHETN
jgi:hypothetical protein